MADHTTHRVEAVCFDAMFTIFESIAPREELIARLIKKYAGVTVAPERIREVTAELRRLYPRGSESMDQWWERVINPRLYRQLGVTNTLHVIRRVRKELFSNTDFYRVEPDMRELLEQLAQRGEPRIALASNHRRRTIRRLLRSFRLDKCFEGRRIYTSQCAGAPKPNPVFFQYIRQHEGLTDFCQVALVGNSLENDGDATKLGVRVCVMDRTGSLSRLRATLPAGITPARNAQEIGEWIRWLCEQTENGGCLALGHE